MRSALAILSLLALASCAKQATTTQRVAGYSVQCQHDERDLGLFNSVVTTSCVPSDPKVLVYVQSGTSVAGGAAAVAAAIPTPPMAAQPMKSIFINEDELSKAMVGALVNALDGKVLVIYTPALRDPITITLHLK